MKSLDELDNATFNAGPSPMDAKAHVVELRPGPASHPAGAATVSLDGVWEMAEGGIAADRLAGDWDDALPATVPGSVHTALWKAGKIPDPYVGMQDAHARQNSFKTWWFKTTFPRPAGTHDETLVFGGVAIKCTVWLNGKELGSHEGMFGGPTFPVADHLKDTNTLVVRIDPAPYAEGGFAGSNAGWQQTVVFNCVYGWHYSDIPALGIWRPVTIRSAPTVKMESPFVATRDATAGVVDLQTDMQGPAVGWSGKLVGTVAPDNFEGDAHHFEIPLKSTTATRNLHLQFTVPGAKLWWPVDMGEPNLYQLTLSFIPDAGGMPDTHEIQFGIRTVEMAPLPGGPDPEKYNWTFVVNGKPMFVKGSNWCTMDPLMGFSRERIDRLLTLARSQHIQMLRAWGSGMPETDEFYDLADRLGIMVLQEWPTAWDSHTTQPYDVLEETVRLNMLRLRNHPSLVMWGGGNESGGPFGNAIDMMGRYSIELDGTRPFHRAEPWGGSRHDYGSDWGRASLDHNLRLTADFFGEFGMFSVPNYESVQRYLPDNEKDLWPAPDGRSFAHHTPVFNKMGDMDRLRLFSGYFTAGKTMETFITGSQLAASAAVRHTLELARTRWPHCAGALYYKLNDNYPAASWACVDWYGAPKMTHFFNMDAFAPLHAVALFETFDNSGKPMSLPIVLLDDANVLEDSPWEVVVRAHDGGFNEVSRKTFTGHGSISDGVRKLGTFELSAAQTKTAPLLFVTEVRTNGELADRTFYWANFLGAQDCLLNLPKTRLTMRAGAGEVVVTNGGSVPAVGVSVSRPGCGETFFADGNFFWLDPGESHTVLVNATEGLKLDAWNIDE